VTLRQIIFLITLLFTSSACFGAKIGLTISSQDSFFTSVCESILTDALTREGFDVSYERFPGARALQQANRGKVDAETCRIKGAEKKWKNLVMVPSIVMPFYGAIFTHVTVRQAITGWQDLEGLKVGIIRGHIYSQKGTAELDSNNVIEASTNEQLLRLLELKRIEAAVMLRHNALDIIYDNPEKYSHVKLSNTNTGKYKTYLYLHKSKIDLMDKISKALEKAVSSGNTVRIYEAHTQKHDALLNTLLSR
jgi:polar amino acid transport system substrate-binding protein